MCGRYAASRSPDDLVEEFRIDRVVIDAPLEPDFNVAPTKPVYAVLDRRARADDARRELRVVTWGLVPGWADAPTIGSRLINARVETAATKPAFRRAFARRRCLLPADGYYEWYTPDGRGTARGAPSNRGGVTKQPFFIRPAGGAVLAMAGLYEIWRDRSRSEDDPGAWLWTCAVLTTQASDALGRIHERMPLLVEPEHVDGWLDPDNDDPQALQAFLLPAAPGRLEAFPVSTAVNSVRNNGPGLVVPIAAEPPPSDAAPAGPTLF